MIKTLLLIVFSFISFPLAAAEVRLAVASNFVPTMRVLSDSFEKNTGHTVIISSGSSGKFVAQIMQGAKYDLFFSADQLKVEALIKKGLADAESQWTYALGTLALWSNKELFFKNEDAIKRLETLNFNKLAIANPRLAPYGQAAEQTLDMLGLLEKTQGKLVFGENVSQAFQFVQTNNADIGFVAFSQLLHHGQGNHHSTWLVPVGMHSAIKQDAVLLKNSLNNVAAIEFVAYMQSKPSAELIKSFGYGTIDDLDNSETTQE